MRTTTALIRVVLVAALVAVGAARPTGQTLGQTLFGGCPLDAAHFYACATEKVRHFNPRRTADGLPDMNGFWSRAVTTEPIPRYRGESDPEVWEAACHEGNRAVPPLLKGGYTRFPGVVPPQVGR